MLNPTTCKFSRPTGKPEQLRSAFQLRKLKNSQQVGHCQSQSRNGVLGNRSRFPSKGLPKAMFPSFPRNAQIGNWHCHLHRPLKRLSGQNVFAPSLSSLVHCNGGSCDSTIFFDGLYDSRNSKRLQLSGCDLLLFFCGVNVTHRHLNTGVPQHRGERW